MIFVDHVWNPARIEQIIGRIDRPLIQKSPFTCSIHMVAVDTLEEDVIPRLYKEADLMKKIFNAENKFEDLKEAQDQGDLFNALTKNQLMSLIRKGKLDL
jgi:SNF2 family DNA or RNA helicase